MKNAAAALNANVVLQFFPLVLTHQRNSHYLQLLSRNLYSMFCVSLVLWAGRSVGLFHVCFEQRNTADPGHG